MDTEGTEHQTEATERRQDSSSGMRDPVQPLRAGPGRAREVMSWSSDIQKSGNGPAMAQQVNRVTEAIIGAAIEVHRELGAGLLESAYQRALAHELGLRGIAFEEQRACSVSYKDMVIDDAYRLDFLVEGLVVVELKAVDALDESHEAQLLTYLRFTGCRVGLLLNFKATTLMRGLRRLAL